MTWTPNEHSRIAIKFWLDCFQVLSVVIGIFAVGITVVKYRSEQKSAAEIAARWSIEQDKRSREQIDAIKRELRRPYEEKKLGLYLEVSRVLAHLASTPTIEKDANEARFWELYWGELAFVESTTTGENAGGPDPSVERLMVEFCHKAFPGECSKGGSSSGSAKSPSDMAAAAIRVARQASKEIRDEWENLGR